MIDRALSLEEQVQIAKIELLKERAREELDAQIEWEQTHPNQKYSKIAVAQEGMRKSLHAMMHPEEAEEEKLSGEERLAKAFGLTEPEGNGYAAEAQRNRQALIDEKQQKMEAMIANKGYSYGR